MKNTTFYYFLALLARNTLANLVAFSSNFGQDRFNFRFFLDLFKHSRYERSYTSYLTNFGCPPYRLINHVVDLTRSSNGVFSPYRATSHNNALRLASNETLYDAAPPLSNQVKSYQSSVISLGLSLSPVILRHEESQNDWRKSYS